MPPLRVRYVSTLLAILASSCAIEHRDAFDSATSRDGADVSARPRDSVSADASRGADGDTDASMTPAAAVDGNGDSAVLRECTLAIRTEAHLRAYETPTPTGRVLAAGTAVDLLETTDWVRNDTVLTQVRERASGATGFLFVDSADLVACQRAMRTAAHLGPLVREERMVRIDGVDERWQLRWRARPERICDSADRVWCGCDGLATGEVGALELVRIRNGVEIDRIVHWPWEQLGWEAAPEPVSRTMALPRWVVGPGAPDDDLTESYLATRPEVPIMRFRDYDHDGNATEFVLESGYVACGHHPYFVVGVSRFEPRLHIFRDADQPDAIAYLDGRYRWEQVAARSPVEVVTWPCGDHGADGITRVARVTADRGRFHFVDGFYLDDESCRHASPFQLGNPYE